MDRELQIILPRLCFHLQTYQVRVFRFVRPGTVQVLFSTIVVQAWTNQESTYYAYRAAAARAKFETLYKAVLNFESLHIPGQCIFYIVTERCLAACK